MASTAARTLLLLFITFCASIQAEKPLRPRNVKLTSVDKGLRVSWEPPNELDGRPVDRYTISYGKSMRTLRFIKVDKDRRSEVLEDVEPGVLHFLKMSAENEEGISKPVYRAETPGGGEWVKLDGFAVVGGAPVNTSSPARPSPTPDTRPRPDPPVRIHVMTGTETGVDEALRPSGLTSPRGQRIRRPPQSSSGPRQPERARAGPALLDQRSQHQQHHTQPQADQRNRHNLKLASESVYVVSLQAQRATGRSAPSSRATLTKKAPPEPEEYEAKDISVRVMSPQSVLISWVDPSIEMEKVLPGDSRHYTVKYREKGESARWEYKETNQRRLLIDTLSADRMYEFSVRISKRDNHGKWSTSVFQRTPESAPSGPPENFHVKALRGKGTAVTATWDPPEEPNGRIREYIMSYAPAMKPFGMKSVTYRGSITSAIVDGLQPGDRYIFKIRATNRRGQGPQTKAFSVAVPRGTTNSAASPPTHHSKGQGGRRTNHTPSRTTEQDSYHDDDTDLQLDAVTEQLTTPTQTTSSATRRTHPLTQTRSYHSIFSDVRGTVRKGATNQQLGGGTSSARDKGRETETEDEQEEEYKTTEPNPEEQKKVRLTNEALEEKKEALTQNNGVPSEPEEEDRSHGRGRGKDPAVDETSSPSLKTEVPSSEGSSSSSKPSYPLRKPLSGRRINSGRRQFSRTSGLGSVFQPKTQDAEMDSASSSSSLSSSPSHSQESAAIRKDDAVTNYAEGKNTYEQPSVTETKPSPSTTEQAISEPEAEAPSVGRSPALPGRGYGYGRRKPGILSRGNQNGRVLTGLRKPGSASTSTGGKIPETSHTHGSHTPNAQDSTHHQEKNDHNDYKNTETKATKEEEPTSNSQTISSTHPSEEDRARGENNYNTPAPPPSRINPFGNRHQSRFGTGTGSSSRASSPRADGRVPWSRTTSSSSVGAGRPLLRGTPSRTVALGAAGATGAAGASGESRTSALQETSEDAKTSSTLYPLKNGERAGSPKPSLPNRSAILRGSRNPITSSSSSNPSSSGRRDSSEPVHRGSSIREDSSNDHEEDYLYEGSKEIYEKVTDPTPVPKTTTTTTTTTTTSAPSTTRRVSQSGDNENVDPKLGRIRPGLIPSSTFPRRPILGPNGRVRSPLLTNRQTASRFPFRAQPAQSTQLDSSNPDTSPSSSSSSSSSLPQPDHRVNGGTSVSTGGSPPSLSLPSLRQTSSSKGSQGSQDSSSSSRDSLGGQGMRMRYPSRSDPFLRGKTPSGGLKPGYGNGNGKNGRPNLTVTSDKEPSTPNDNTKPNGRRYITGPDGAKWVVDLDEGVLMNENGMVLQDSQGRPRRVVLGEDGRTIFDHQGSPLVNQEGQALFGHGRESQPLVNPKDKFLTVGGKPVIGLDRPKPRTTTTTTTTTRPPTTTTPEPTTLPTTTEMTTEETTTMLVFPSCPPGMFLIRDENGFPMLDADGVLDCYPEDEMLWQTTLPPTLPPTTTTPDPPTPEPESRPFNNSPSNEFDLTGKKRFTAPYVNFIQKDPGAPCSLTEALEYLQVDVLENLFKKDSLASNQKQPPKNKPHNITVVAMEGCHSFVILDWAIPLKDDMVSGYMVHSASYDDILNNRWSSSASSGTHLAVENLKPNSRYYFKVQAKNIFGLGPVSDTLTYVTESDDPLLIERPPGGEPIWIPFSFRFNPQHSACKGSQYVKRTWYRKFVGVILCNSLRYKIFMGDGLKEMFHSIADTFGHGEDHCQFVDSYLDGRTGSPSLSTYLPTAQGYYRSYRQEPVNFGPIGRRTPHPFVGWYECGVPIPGKW
ncbi:fibronectin type III domain-containing protein 1 [Oncorhynchus nerka]|uniref:fibronectin type III domain-containing protein 1 n=1 Tax=Oncorhynchus nerka TaxID=8023 RepID=UPI0031B850B2